MSRDMPRRYAFAGMLFKASAMLTIRPGWVSPPLQTTKTLAGRTRSPRARYAPGFFAVFLAGGFFPCIPLGSSAGLT
jgi:hypothetical protein